MEVQTHEVESPFPLLHLVCGIDVDGFLASARMEDGISFFSSCVYLLLILNLNSLFGLVGRAKSIKLLKL